MIGAITAGLFSTGVAASTTAYESIATVTIGAGGATSATFSSIPSTYKHLQIRGFARNSAADYTISARFNSDSGSNYTIHQLYGDGSTTGAYANASTAGGVPIGQTAFGTSIFGAFVCDILDYANTNKYKTSRSLVGQDRNGAGQILLESGLWSNTAAISNIEVRINGTALFEQYSSFALYGIKG